MTSIWREAASMLGLPVLLLGLGAAPADGQQAGRTTMVVAGGGCEAPALHAGTRMGCTSTGVVYTLFPNGRAIIVVGVGAQRTLAFVAENDRQVRAEEYVLYLSRARLVTNGTETVSNITGLCRVSMSTDGRYWTRIRCDASDEESRPFRLQFKGNGEPITVQRSQ